MIALIAAFGIFAGTAGDPAVEGRFARLALDCIHREYPNKISHVLSGDEHVAPPRELYPVFYGCFDWHSAVHAHWMLARLLRLHPEADYAPEISAALEKSFQTDRIAAEVAYFNSGEYRQSFERPYGLAWFLQLMTELREWDAEQAVRWRARLAPLEAVVVDRIRSWLPKLSHPIRTGEHSQTAFAFGLYRDWAVAADDRALRDLVDARTRTYHLADRDCPLAYEPSGQDFLSPCLAEADLMRRVLDPAAFSDWLAAFMPMIPTDGSSAWLEAAVVTDKSDGKLAHLDGLNLSRAWMLDGIASGLPAGDPRIPSLEAASNRLGEAGLAAVTGEDYAGGHWLASFATYLVTRRGISTPP
ncbi:MAG: DUF2891 domain-containing protein [Xanthomonadales bacterium]|nr:DUF2891 domain-containing protein [Xanthomonadales bacterium]